MKSEIQKTLKELQRIETQAETARTHWLQTVERLTRLGSPGHGHEIVDAAEVEPSDGLRRTVADPTEAKPRPGGKPVGEVRKAILMHMRTHANEAVSLEGIMTAVPPKTERQQVLTTIGNLKRKGTLKSHGRGFYRLEAETGAR